MLIANWTKCHHLDKEEMDLRRRNCAHFAKFRSKFCRPQQHIFLIHSFGHYESIVREKRAQNGCAAAIIIIITTRDRKSVSAVFRVDASSYTQHKQQTHTHTHLL